MPKYSGGLGCESGVRLCEVQCGHVAGSSESVPPSGSLPQALGGCHRGTRRHSKRQNNAFTSVYV